MAEARVMMRMLRILTQATLRKSSLAPVAVTQSAGQTQCDKTKRQRLLAEGSLAGSLCTSNAAMACQT